MELFEGIIAIFVIYIIYKTASYYDDKNERERKHDK